MRGLISAIIFVAGRSLLISSGHGDVVAELGSVFYSVREKNFDERGIRRHADREFSRKAELETEMARQREA